MTVTVEFGISAVVLSTRHLLTIKRYLDKAAVLVMGSVCSVEREGVDDASERVDSDPCGSGRRQRQRNGQSVAIVKPWLVRFDDLAFGISTHLTSDNPLMMIV